MLSRIEALAVCNVQVKIIINLTSVLEHGQVIKSMTSSHQIISCNRIPCVTASDHHSAKSLPHVSKAGSQGKHRHYLTSHSDIKLGL